jgi:hypothetical protein
MIAGILSFLGNLLGGPFAKAAVEAYRARLAADNTAEKTAADLAARELALQQREAELTVELRKAQIGRWYEPEHLFGYTMVVYFAKVVLWDKVLGPVTGGSTDPLAGDVATWAGMIMLFYFGKRGFENVARILRR